MVLLPVFSLGRFLTMASKINPVGADARDNLVQTYPHLDRMGKVDAIRNGIDLSPFLIEEQRDLRTEAGLESRAMLVGFFGLFVAGVPVIATQYIGLAEVTKDTPAVCFEAGNPESLVMALAYFRRNQRDITVEVRAYSVEAARRFDVQSTASLVRALMDSVIPEQEQEQEPGTRRDYD